MTTEIKFECISCQQRILVHADAAGMATDCPTCGSSVTIPKTSGLNDRHYAAPKWSRDQFRPSVGQRDPMSLSDGGVDFDSSELTALRQDLAEASVEATRLERELSDAQAELAAARAEADKLHANARHTQAELKSFQTERLTLKNDLSSLRQKLTAAEERFDGTQLELLDAQARLGEQETELEQTHRAVEALRALIAELRVERAQLRDEASRADSERSTSQETAASLTTELRKLETEFEAAKELLNEAQVNRTVALREIGTLTEERVAMLVQLEEARAQLAALAQTERELKTAEDALTVTRQQLGTAEDNARKRQQEIGELRRTLSEKTVGRDFIEVRGQLKDARAEHVKLSEEARQLRASLADQENAALAAEDRVKEMRQQLSEARRAAEAASELRLRRDNDVLRGIVARQNGELAQKHIQLVRLKRARLALKIVYSVFAFGLLAIAVCAAKFVPALGF